MEIFSNDIADRERKNVEKEGDTGERYGQTNKEIFGVFEGQIWISQYKNI